MKFLKSYTIRLEKNYLLPILTVCVLGINQLRANEIKPKTLKNQWNLGFYVGVYNNQEREILSHTGSAYGKNMWSLVPSGLIGMSGEFGRWNVFADLALNHNKQFLKTEAWLDQGNVVFTSTTTRNIQQSIRWRTGIGYHLWKNKFQSILLNAGITAPLGTTGSHLRKTETAITEGYKRIITRETHYRNYVLPLFSLEYKKKFKHDALCFFVAYTMGSKSDLMRQEVKYLRNSDGYSESVYGKWNGAQVTWGAAYQWGSK